MSAFTRIEHLENQLRMMFEDRQAQDRDVSTQHNQEQHNPNEMLSEQTVDETLRSSELVRPAQQDQLSVNEDSVVGSQSFVEQEKSYQEKSLSPEASCHSSVESIDEPPEGPPSPFDNKGSHTL